MIFVPPAMSRFISDHNITICEVFLKPEFPSSSPKNAKTQLERPSLSFDPTKIAVTSSSGNKEFCKLQRSEKIGQQNVHGLWASFLVQVFGGVELMFEVKAVISLLNLRISLPSWIIWCSPCSTFAEEHLGQKLHRHSLKRLIAEPTYVPIYWVVPPPSNSANEGL